MVQIVLLVTQQVIIILFIFLFYIYFVMALFQSRFTCMVALCSYRCTAKVSSLEVIFFSSTFLTEDLEMNLDFYSALRHWT